MREPAIKPLVATQFLTNAAAVYYTAPTGQPNFVALVNSFIIANTDSAAHSITIHNVPAGGTATAGNQIFPATPIPANTTWIGRYEEAVVIPAGGTIQALADADDVLTLTMSGKEYS